MFHSTSMMSFAFSSCSDGIIRNNYVESISRRSFTEIFSSLTKNSDVPSFLVKWKMRERNGELVSQRR